MTENTLVKTAAYIYVSKNNSMIKANIPCSVLDLIKPFPSNTYFTIYLRPIHSKALENLPMYSRPAKEVYFAELGNKEKETKSSSKQNKTYKGLLRFIEKNPFVTEQQITQGLDLKESFVLASLSLALSLKQVFVRSCELHGTLTNFYYAKNMKEFLEKNR